MIKIISCEHILFMLLEKEQKNLFDSHFNVEIARIKAVKDLLLMT